MTDPIFALPILFGVLMAVLSFGLFRRVGISSRYFAIALLLSMGLIASPLIFYVLEAVKQFFGIRFTFVIGFGLANTVVLVLLGYITLTIGKLRNEINHLWQEIALLRNEIEDSDN
jgi:hypothetical protein